MRAGDRFCLFLLVGLLGLGLCLVHSHWAGKGQAERLARVSRVVGEVGLTDLVLATEARHTRHPSQADRHAAFQSHPLALDHFPSGSLIRAPKEAGTAP